MDFFEAQERARRITWKLILLYATAVVLLISTVYVVALILFGFNEDPVVTRTESFTLWHPTLFITISTIIIAVILAGTLFRIAQLRKGGAAVAEMLGGRKVDPSTYDTNERRLLNVVEEMSIASGLPVPDVYVLDQENGINAFAAGFGTSDAAVGITKGALHQLNRDELQGVIAHEFSHIFNGDMRLNIRLISVLNGILLLHLMGLILMRSAALSNATRGGSRGGGNATIAIVLFGLALVIIGYMGMVFGRMIQAAISRQREYLADAAAVQYTRNPDGIAGALEKIARSHEKGRIEDGHAMELSHLFFANSFHSALDRLFATHPPIDERIRAIGAIPLQERPARQSARAVSPTPPEPTSDQSDWNLGEVEEWAGILLATIGTLRPDQLRQASSLLADIPEPLTRAAHEPLGAESLLYALLLTSGKNDSPSLPDWLNSEVDSGMIHFVESFVQELNRGKREWHLPLVELALPTLRTMSQKQYQRFRLTLDRLIREKREVSLFEFAIEKMVLRQLDPHFSEVRKPDVRHHHFRTLTRELSILLSALAHAGGEKAEYAWKAGTQSLGKHLPDGVTFLSQEECSIAELDTALDELAASANPVKKHVLSAAIHTVAEDKKITVEEQEMLRAISEVLETPVPLGAFGIASFPKR